MAIILNKKAPNAVLEFNFKNGRMISVCFQGKPLNITVIQICALISDAQEAEVERFCEDLEDVLELTPKKDVLFLIGDWNGKVESPLCGVTDKLALEYKMKKGKG